MTVFRVFRLDDGIPVFVCDISALSAGAACRQGALADPRSGVAGITAIYEAHVKSNAAAYEIAWHDGRFIDGIEPTKRISKTAS